MLGLVKDGLVASLFLACSRDCLAQASVPIVALAWLCELWLLGPVPWLFYSSVRVADRIVCDCMGSSSGAVVNVERVCIHNAHKLPHAFPCSHCLIKFLTSCPLKRIWS